MDKDEIKLSQDEIEWIKKKVQQERAMSAISKKIRDLATFVTILLGATILLWDQFKVFIQSALR